MDLYMHANTHSPIRMYSCLLLQVHLVSCFQQWLYDDDRRIVFIYPTISICFAAVNNIPLQSIKCSLSELDIMLFPPALYTELVCGNFMHACTKICQYPFMFIPKWGPSWFGADEPRAKALAPNTYE